MGFQDSYPKLPQTPLMDIGDQSNKNKVVDMSPFFLFEAVGDSDGDHHHDHDQSILMKMMMVGRLGEVHTHFDRDEDHEDYDDDDDAQSCSHDVWDHHDLIPTSHHDGTFRSTIHQGVHHDHHSSHGDDGNGEVMSKKGSSKGFHDGDAWKEMSHLSRSRYDCDHHHHHDQHHHNNDRITSEVMSTANSHASRDMFCVDSCEGKKMSEKERNRLFWETCLAS